MLLCRMAENAYWLGRYLERAEDLARALLAYEEIRLDMPGQRAPGWQRLASLAGLDDIATAELDAEGIVARVVLDRDNPSSILGALHAARENLRQARAILPSECWHLLNPRYLELASMQPSTPPVELRGHLERVVASCREVAGRVAATLMRDDGYSFLRIGAHVERADMMFRVATIVATTLMPTGRDEPFADVRAMGLLKAVGAFGTYRHRYHARADFKNTVDLLLYAPSFPRSFVYTLLEIGRDLDGLPRNAEALAALQACWPLETVDSRPALDAFVGRALPHLAALGAALALTYFSPSLPPEASAAQPPRASTVRPGETKLDRQEPKEPSLDARS